MRSPVVLGGLCAAAALLAAGCAEHFPMPMTSAELTSYPLDRSGPALAAYLGQRDASPTVCDLHASGPHVELLSEGVRGALTDALTDGKVDPELWRRCAAAFLRSAPPGDAGALLDTIAPEYRSILKSSDLDKKPAQQERLRAMQRLYLERQSAVHGTAKLLDPMFDDLRRALLRGRLGPAAVGFGQELVQVVDMERGLWKGRPVDVGAIDTLFAENAEDTLKRLSDRLPDPALRDEARRRVVRLHIAASPFPEVREHAADVEATVMKTGRNAVALDEHSPSRGYVDASKMPVRGVLVRQDVWKQAAKLIAYAGDAEGVSVLPELKLRGVLMIELAGVSRPVTLCGPAQDLDPSPCVLAEDVRIDNPVAYLDKGGAFHFVDSIWMKDAVRLTALEGKFSLPVSVGGKPLLSLAWPFSYERPDDLVFVGRAAGEDGPPLRVGVDHQDRTGRFVFTATGPGTYSAVVEARDAPAFRVGSRGAKGSTGSSGSTGMSGASGAECQSGSSGSGGGPGGSGGKGGNGGPVVVDVACGGAPCDGLIAELRAVVVSLGGPGGDGGSGGRGGRGGSGGAGRSPRTHIDSNGHTVTDDSGCSAGSSGSNGPDGVSGPNGSRGRGGPVSFQAAR